ncbi:MAG TPA: acetyl-CoA carboxylase biotin carboxyl carrier protein [Terriglobia bacterium]|nr:acetyl-CoA carboxylase biotin carboxyl carrier protein [Terriglobia bacterium]
MADKNLRPEQAWSLKDIEKLMDSLAERNISEFEMEKDGLRVRIKRGEAHTTGVPSTSPTAPPANPFPAGIPFPSSPHPPATASLTEAAAAESTEGLHLIKSPIVGTYYGAPAPNAPPFVKGGDVVQVGTVLCIIEAMKLMNEIESEVAGEIARIYVEDGQPVEYGQSLFAIKPSHKK